MLAKENEDPQLLYKLRPEQILIRWFNYHITLNKENREIKNLAKDLSDGYAYGHVFSHIYSEFNQDYWQLDPKQRAARIM